MGTQIGSIAVFDEAEFRSKVTPDKLLIDEVALTAIHRNPSNAPSPRIKDGCIISFTARGGEITRAATAKHYREYVSGYLARHPRESIFDSAWGARAA